MATNAERTKAICDALINGVSTQAQQLELAEGLHDPVNGLFAGLPNAQKAAIIPNELRQYVINRIRQLRQDKARATIPDPSNDYPEGV